MNVRGSRGGRLARIAGVGEDSCCRRCAYRRPRITRRSFSLRCQALAVDALQLCGVAYSLIQHKHNLLLVRRRTARSDGHRLHLLRVLAGRGDRGPSVCQRDAEACAFGICCRWKPFVGQPSDSYAVFFLAVSPIHSTEVVSIASCPWINALLRSYASPHRPCTNHRARCRHGGLGGRIVGGEVSVWPPPNPAYMDSPHRARG